MNQTEIRFGPTPGITGRRCGTCTLCCKLLPVREIHKQSGQRCAHQRLSGCVIYQRRPDSCRVWSCLWLAGRDTEGLRRPDHARYVVDMVPDEIRIKYEDRDDEVIPVIQVRVDPVAPDAHTDPGLRAYLARRGEEGYATIIRYSSHDAFVLMPPAMTGDDWYEVRSNITIKE